MGLPGESKGCQRGEIVHICYKEELARVVVLCMLVYAFRVISTSISTIQRPDVPTN